MKFIRLVFLTFIFLLTIIYATKVSAQDNVCWQLREFKKYKYYEPEIYFYVENNTLVIDSSKTDESLGYAYVFTVLPKDWLNGRIVSIKWRGYFTYLGSRTLATLNLIDGVLDRRDESSYFKPEQDSEGIFNLRNIELAKYDCGAIGWCKWREDKSDILNLSDWGDYVTLVIRFRDDWIQQLVILQVSEIKILNPDGSVFKVLRFEGNPVMERTGTYNDYGYIGNCPNVGTLSTCEISNPYISVVFPDNIRCNEPTNITVYIASEKEFCQNSFIDVYVNSSRVYSFDVNNMICNKTSTGISCYKTFNYVFENNTEVRFVFRVGNVNVTEFKRQVVCPGGCQLSNIQLSYSYPTSPIPQCNTNIDITLYVSGEQNNCKDVLLDVYINNTKVDEISFSKGDCSMPIGKFTCSKKIKYNVTSPGPIEIYVKSGNAVSNKVTLNLNCTPPTTPQTTCKLGYYWDENSKKCVQRICIADFQCGTGYHCSKFRCCPIGYTWNDEKQECVPAKLVMLVVPLGGTWQELGADPEKIINNTKTDIDIVYPFISDRVEIVKVDEPYRPAIVPIISSVGSLCWWYTTTKSIYINSILEKYNGVDYRVIFVTTKDIIKSICGDGPEACANLNNGNCVFIPSSPSPLVIAHELGHTFGLVDEYCNNVYLPFMCGPKASPNPIKCEYGCCPEPIYDCNVLGPQKINIQISKTTGVKLYEPVYLWINISKLNGCTNGYIIIKQVVPNEKKIGEIQLSTPSRLDVEDRNITYHLVFEEPGTYEIILNFSNKFTDTNFTKTFRINVDSEEFTDFDRFFSFKFDSNREPIIFSVGLPVFYDPSAIFINRFLNKYKENLLNKQVFFTGVVDRHLEVSISDPSSVELCAYDVNGNVIDCTNNSKYSVNFSSSTPQKVVFGIKINNMTAQKYISGYSVRDIREIVDFYSIDIRQFGYCCFEAKPGHHILYSYYHPCIGNYMYTGEPNTYSVMSNLYSAYIFGYKVGLSKPAYDHVLKRLREMKLIP